MIRPVRRNQFGAVDFSQVEEFIGSEQVQQALNSVVNQAQQAVVIETRKNAVNMLALAVAGGAVGGFILRGTTGKVLAGVVGAYALYRLVSSPGQSYKRNNNQDK
jgi:outer membrane lipoprotein SlyB